MNLKKYMYLASVLLLFACVGKAQTDTTSPQQFYRLDFLVKQLDHGRAIDSRNYTMEVSLAQSGGLVPHTSSIRTGTKVPVQTDPGKYQYIDVGVNIDCQHVRSAGDGLAMEVAADVSDVAKQSPTNAYSIPLIRQDRWDSDVFVPLHKQTVLFTSDDPASTSAMELDVTATPVP